MFWVLTLLLLVEEICEMKTRGIIWILPLMAAFCGCATWSNPKQAMNTRPNEAIVVGNIRVLYEGQDIAKNTYFSTSNGKQTVLHKLHESSFLTARLPVGENSLTRMLIDKGGLGLWARDFVFQAGDIAFTLREPGRAYYIGEITIDCTPGKSHIDWNEMVKTAAPVTVLASPFVPVVMAAYIVTPKRDHQLAISIQNKLPTAEGEFRKRFQTQMGLVESLVKLSSTNITTKSL